MDTIQSTTGGCDTALVITITEDPLIPKPVSDSYCYGDRQTLTVEGAGLMVGQAEAAYDAAVLWLNVGRNAEFGLGGVRLPGRRVQVFKDNAGAGESGGGKWREGNVGVAGNALRGHRRQGNTLQRAASGERHGKRSLVELAGYVGAGVERERGQTIQFGVAGDGNVTGQTMEFGETMLTPIAAETAFKLAGDESFTIGKF